MFVIFGNSPYQEGTFQLHILLLDRCLTRGITYFSPIESPGSNCSFSYEFVGLICTLEITTFMEKVEKGIRRKK